MNDFCKVLLVGGAFLVLLLPLFVSESLFFPYITGKNFAFRILVELMLGAWIVLALLDTRYRPRFSWLLVSSGVLLLVMLVANLLGEYPPKSFWSNYERMDGYVTLVHFFLYFLILASSFHTKKIWCYFLGTSVAVAGLVAFMGLQQYLGGDTDRIDATLGNSTYMAIYMLFHIFLLGFLLLQTKVKTWWFAAAPLLILFVYVLLQTGTRGTFIGLAAGGVTTVAYMALFARRYPEVRKVAAAGLLGIVLLGGIFFAVKDTAFIQNNMALARYANIDLQEDLEVRMTIWGMAWEGVQERPVLGWGQGGFNYVFNKNFDPFLYDQEPWFDRTHNIIFDWLVAGGFLGLLSYLSIFVALAYYLFWRPLRSHDTNNDDSYFSVPERALFIGLLVGYFVHNLVVFDNLVSYVFFAVVLALVHARVSTPIAAVENARVPHNVVQQVVAPLVLIVSLGVVYVVNVPSILAARDIIDGLTASSVEVKLTALETARSRNSFADQEIAEQSAHFAMQLMRNGSVTPEERVAAFRQAEDAMQQMIEKKPGDARLYVFAGNLYTVANQDEQAYAAFSKAHEYAPRMQAILLPLGLAAYRLEDYERAEEHFQTAYELAPYFEEPRALYAAILLHQGKTAEAEALLSEDFSDFAESDVALRIVYDAGAFDVVAEMLEERIAKNPQDSQVYLSLTSLYYEQGEVDAAIAVLERMKTASPSAATTTDCIIDNLEAGNEPNEGC